MTSKASPDSPVAVHGHFDPGWEAVRDAFVANFSDGLELGASVFVTHEGRPVVDLWGGDADCDGNPWQTDTIVNVYSTTKTMTAIAALMLIDRQLLDPDAPVASYWPEFGANGKEAITVAHLLSHAAGLSGFEQVMTPEHLYDWQGCIERLEAQRPWWKPGSAPGYHPVTQGYLVGEVIRRIDGRSVGTFLRDEVADPLGADFHLGFGPELDERCGQLLAPDGPQIGGVSVDQPASRPWLDPQRRRETASVALRTFSSHPLTGREPQTRAWRQAEIPAANGFGNARSVGRIHAALANGGSIDGVRLLDNRTIERAGETEIAGEDLVLKAPIAYGLGFGVPSPLIPLPNPKTLFWGGWGGSLAIIDPAASLTISYVMNRMSSAMLGDQRGPRLATAAYMKLLADLG